MNQNTIEWVEKAEGDWQAAQSLYRVRKHPNYDAVCFHSQQCAEKYLKGRLEEAGIAFNKTHDLPKLHTQVLPIEPSWKSLQLALDTLTAYSVDYRYPGMTADKIEAKNAIKHCRTVRKAARLSLGLPL